MLVWLASFPRSGNTLSRTLLNLVFDLPTYSKYERAGSPEMHAEIVGLIGARAFSGEYDAFLAAARAASGPVVVKTHDTPEDRAPAVYVVRNGLVATDSYRHYLQAVYRRPVAWEEVVGNCPPYGNWSSHLDAWNPLQRPRTLLLRYEDMLSEPEAVIARLSSFLGVAPALHWRNPFQDLHRLGPNFFRRGRAEVPETLSMAERSAFLAAHRPRMERLGYDC